MQQEEWAVGERAPVLPSRRPMHPCANRRRWLVLAGLKHAPGRLDLGHHADVSLTVRMTVTDATADDLAIQGGRMSEWRLGSTAQCELGARSCSDFADLSDALGEPPNMLSGIEKRRLLPIGLLLYLVSMAVIATAMVGAFFGTGLLLLTQPEMTSAGARGQGFVSPDIAFDYYDSTVDVNGTNGVPTQLNSGHLRIIRPGVSFDFQDAVLADLPATNLAILKVSQGLPGLGASSNQEAMPQRVGNRTDFTKFAGELTRVQNLVTFGEVGTALKLSLGGQYTGDILQPSEKFFCCGLRWSRGYFYGQVTGDRGVGTTAELQFNTGFTDVPILAADHRLDVQFYGFYDFGRFYNLAPGEFNQTVDSVGIGARSNLTSWLFVDLAALRRLVTQPNGANVSGLPDYALFSRVTVQY
jgi:hypothetical protein